MKNKKLTVKKHQLPENKGACSLVTQMITDFDYIFFKSVSKKWGH